MNLRPFAKFHILTLSPLEHGSTLDLGTQAPDLLGKRDGDGVKKYRLALGWKDAVVPLGKTQF